MAELKTKPTKRSAASFIKEIKDPEKRNDAKTLLKLFKEVTNEKPILWGPSIIGFGTYHYTYASGREGDWMRTGFSPRNQNFSIYVMPGYEMKEYAQLLKRLGPHSLGKSCLYIKNLKDIDLPTLKKIVATGYKEMKKRYPKN